jgi:hypothetical protein
VETGGRTTGAATGLPISLAASPESWYADQLRIKIDTLHCENQVLREENGIMGGIIEYARREIVKKLLTKH